MTTEIANARRVVVTRSKEGNRELAESLSEAGFEAIAVDTLSFLPPRDWEAIDICLRALHRYDWLLFTSRVGVRYFLSRMHSLLLDLPGDGPKVAAIGAGTRRELELAGIRVAFAPSEYLTQRLAAELPLLEGGKRLLILRTDMGDSAMRNILQKRGFVVEEQVIYGTRFIPGESESDLSSVDAIIFASPSAVSSFCRRISRQRFDLLLETPVVCIGPVTARAAKARGFRKITTPKTYTFDSVVEELGRLKTIA